MNECMNTIFITNFNYKSHTGKAFCQKGILGYKYMEKLS